MENIVFVMMCWICGAIFVLIGFSCFKKTEPTGFWSGVEVRKDEVIDVKGYNVANGIMWCIFSIFFWVSGILAIFNSFVAVVMLIIACTVGIVGLILGYGWIKRRFFVCYRDKYVASKLNDYK